MMALLESVRRVLMGHIIQGSPTNRFNHFLMRSMLLSETGADLSFRNHIIEVSKGNRVIRVSDRHYAYLFDLARNFDIYFNPVVPRSDGNRLLVDYSAPAIHRFIDPPIDFELASFPEENGMIEDYFRWYRPRLNDIVFDVGAHCGTSTYTLSKLVGDKGRVVAFEPDPQVFRILQGNLARHNLKNVVPVQAAMSGTNGTAEFLAESALGSSLLRTSVRRSSAKPQSVRTITLQQACLEFGDPSFCKIDIEAAEVEVLTAAIPFLRNVKIQFALDTNHFFQGSLTNGAVEAIFREAGYRVESSAAGGCMTTWAAPES